MIGGMAGNNACGANSAVYGSTREHLASARGILSDGSVAEFGPAIEPGIRGEVLGRYPRGVNPSPDQGFAGRSGQPGGDFPRIPETVDPSSQYGLCDRSARLIARHSTPPGRNSTFAG